MNSQKSIAIDTASNLLITGYFKDSTNFSQGSYTHIGVDESEIYLLKIDTNGNYIWSYDFASISYDVPEKIHIDENNNIYLTGFFRTNVDFSPSNYSSLLSTAGRSTFLTKFYEGFYYASLSEKSSDKESLIYPNPARTEVFLNYPFSETKNLELVFYDITGKVVIYTPFVTNNYSIEVLESGIYLVAIESNGIILSQSKLVKQ